MSNVNIELDFHSDTALVKYRDIAKKCIRSKVVSLGELLRAIREQRRSASGLLPAGTRFFAGNELDFFIGIEVPPLRKTITTHHPSSGDMATECVPIPPTLFVFEVSDNMIKHSAVYALKGSITSNSNLVYVFPYGNTYADRGAICWGTQEGTHEVEGPLSCTSVVTMKVA